MPQTNLNPSGFHTAVTTHNCSISSKSRVHPQATPQTFPVTNSRHSFLSCTIHHTCQHSNLFSSNSHSLNQSTSSAVDLLNGYPHLPTYTLSAILSFSILSICPNQRRTLSFTTFATPYNSLIRAFSTTSILPTPSKALKLSI